MSYRYELFEKALKAEEELASAQSVKDQKKAQRKFDAIANELYFSGWRNEYDLWCQNLKE